MANSESLAARAAGFLRRLVARLRPQATAGSGGGDTASATVPEPPTGPGATKNERYDLETVEVMRRCMGRGAMGIDGGAHLGEFLAKMRDIAPDGRHLAFEPLPHLARHLEQHFPGVRIVEKALGDRAGRAEFQYVVNAPGYSGLRQRAYDRPDPVIETLDVEVVRLDDVLAPDDHPAFLKLDLEGGEYHALLGAEQILRRCRPLVVFEAHERSSGHYGVSPDMLFAFFDERLDYGVNTQRAWLDGLGALDLETFRETYVGEFCFLAFPR